MAHNARRAARMQRLNVAALKQVVDAGTLSSAAALYELAQRGVPYARKGAAS
jgi:hypothetical protein